MIELINNMDLWTYQHPYLTSIFNILIIYIAVTIYCKGKAKHKARGL